MDTKKLRQKILDLAIHGKLVPQDPNDEPASVLLERIRAEKERLIAEGKIKRSKKSATSDTPHYENRQVGEANVPFEVPTGWCWSRFGEFVDVRDGTHDSPKYVANGIPFVTSKNLKNGEIDFSTVSYISEEDHQNFIKRSKVDVGDILFAMIGSIGNPVKVNITKEFSIKNVALFKPFVKSTNMDYVLLFLLFVQGNLQKDAKGGMQPFIPLSYFRKDLYIPLPPEKEQETIVSEVKKLLTIVDDIEQRKQDLSTAISQTKNRILDLAIHGKLVPQDANDEPASELLKRINPKAAASCDNPHYGNIPNGWIMLKGQYLFEPMKSIKPTEEFFKYIDIDSIDNKRGVVIAPKIIPSNNAPSRASRYTCKGDVLFSMVRPYLRNIAAVPEDDCIASTGFFVCHPTAVMIPEFCYYLMESSYIVDGLNQFMKGDNSPSINNKNITEWIYPIPPIEEQIRIVTKIQELYATLDSITDALR